MTENSTKSCTRCGTLISDETAGGLCPRCLMAMNFDSRTMPEGEEPPHAPILTPEELAEKFPQYEILECLGRGGMGVVYKARQKSLDRIVAIKILPPERVGEERFSDRFAVEAATLAKLSHPNIVTVHDFGETGGLFYIVMEYVDGVNLRDLLRDGKLEPKQALAIVPPICDALQYAHDKGIVHRDIKPENLLLDRDGRIKIADFGIASLVGAYGEIAGTPPYMAPEQSAARNGIDPRTDIYALGVVLYEMLTGERPDREVVAPSNRVEIDVRLDEIVLRALEKKPELRYQTAGEFRTVVETMAAAPPPLQEDSTRRKKRRKKVIFRFLDPLPDKSELLRMALTMLLAGLAIIALMGDTWEKAREWIDQTLDPEQSAEGHILRSVLFMTCAVVALILVWKLIQWLTARRSDGGNPSRIGSFASAWLWLGSAALVLAFSSNPWGATSWQCLIAAAALLSAWEILKRSGNSTRNAIELQPAAGKITDIPPYPPAHPTNNPQGVFRNWWWVIVLGTIIIAALAVMRRGSDWADQQHPLTDISGPQAFGHVIERVVHEMESGLGNEALRLESGELFSLPKSMTNEWLAESSADLLVGRTGADFQLILHKGILRDMSNADWDHATPETFRRAMEKGPGKMKPGKSENRWGAYDWTDGHVPATFGFHLASRAQGMLQVIGDTPDGNGLKIRYKLLPGPNGETILPPDFELVRDRATEIARRHYPDFKISMDGDRFIMQRNLRQFDVHNSSKNGDVSAETHKETGPAADGFLLVLEPIVEAPVSQAFQADGPQILDRPYWKAFVDHRFDPEKHSGVAMFFDFGPAVNAEFKEAMLSLLEMMDRPGVAELEKEIQSDKIAIEDLALHMIVAIREMDDGKLKSLASDSIKGWRDALPVFAVEMREHYRQMVGDEKFDLRASESLVDGDLAAVKCTGPEKLKDVCLILFFVKTEAGWRNHSLKNAPKASPLAQHLADLKANLRK